MVTKMKAAVLYESGNALVMERDIPIPPLEEGQVLIKVFYSGVCHSQLMEALGKRGEDKWLPHLMGHEGTGEVVKTGPGIKKVKPGDRVILTWIKGEGMNVGGAKYRKGPLTINSGSITTFSDYTIISENRCVRLPEGVPMDVGSLFGCALLTGAGIVINTVKPNDGSTVAVFGLGGIGLSALMALRLFKCRMVIAIDVEDAKLETAAKFGATHRVNSMHENPVEVIRRLTGGIGVDYAIEAAGMAKTIETAFESVRRGGGKCVFASHPAHDERISLDPFELISGKQIIGSWGGESKPDTDIPLFAKAYLDGILPLEELITHRYPLEGINDALNDIKNRKVGRALLEIAPES